ncbi:MAG: polyprenyl synthetase family protein, partial [Chloroflexi bacterium]|nr:polyprenyl synthetase family protein [Chloroflexota bacterium]
LFARAAKLAAETDYLPLMKLFSETLAIIVNGELTQMFSARGVINRENYSQRIYAKTASLFEMISRSAAMVSPVDDTVIESMRVFGNEVGIAFQIVDDILDYTGEQTAIGKPVGSDLLNGLVTLPAIYYAESHPDDKDVKSLAEGGWGNEEHMARLVSSIRKTVAAGDQRALSVGIPRRRSAPSIRSSWTSVAVCNNSTAAPSVMSFSSGAPSMFPTSRPKVGRMRFPPAAKICSKAARRSG